MLGSFPLRRRVPEERVFFFGARWAGQNTKGNRERKEVEDKKRERRACAFRLTFPIHCCCTGFPLFPSSPLRPHGHVDAICRVHHNWHLGLPELSFPVEGGTAVYGVRKKHTGTFEDSAMRRKCLVNMFLPQTGSR
jgi:hypothetical protein